VIHFREARPQELQGIGEEEISRRRIMHARCVKSAVALKMELSALAEEKNFGAEFAESKRRLGFQYDEMLLHEHYFGVLKAGLRPEGGGSTFSRLRRKLFGKYELWLEEFGDFGRSQGIGWAILYYDPRAE
jgi:Fe-Mn family superoxide dismutase